MGRVYVCTFDNISLSIATDIIQGTLGADTSVRLMELSLGNFSDLGDAAEEVLRIGLFRGVTAGSGGSAGTETALEPDNTAVSDVTALINNTTASTGGTQIDLIPWNIRIPLLWCPIPELFPPINAASDPFAFRLMAAPTDAISVSGCLKWQEGT